MHFRNKQQAANPSHRPKRSDSGARVPSTAWLAAQAAFSREEPATAEPAAQDAAEVGVRRSWSPTVLASAGASASASTTTALSAFSGMPARVLTPADAVLPPGKPARVFLVVPDVAATATAAAAHALAGAEPGNPPSPREFGQWPPEDAAPVARQRRQRRQLRADKLPGPVRHVTHAIVQVPVVPPRPLEVLSFGEQVTSLQTLMTQLNAVFDSIQQARTFQFPD